MPLAGEGENIEPVARVQIPGANEVELAGDWAFMSVEKAADGGEGGGLVIVNIADPTRPFVQGRWNASSAGITDAGYADVDLSPDGNLAVLTNSHCSDCKEGVVAWAVLIDVSDKSKPKLLGKVVDDATMDYVHTSTLDGDTLYLNPQVAPFYPQPGNAHITVVDISNPAQPVKTGVIAPPGADAGLAHDSYVDHRPDGKTLLYAASINKSDVIDITDPLDSTWLQSATSTYTLSHDVQPNHDRSIILVDDEGLAGGQLDESVSACGKVGSGPASLDSGSIHFLRAAPDGTFANGGAVHLGTFNAPTNVNQGACVAHVFWQAPDENRLTQAFYRTGAFVLDFEDPSNPQMLGWFVAEGGSIYWSNKPHRGYLYASDMEHGLDILKYTGEGGTRWPATAGPAEVQRSARQGVPYVPIAGVATPTPTATPPATAGPSSQPTPSGSTSGGSASDGGANGGQPVRELGRLRLALTLKRVPGRVGRKTRLTVAFTDAAGDRVGRVSVRRATSKRARILVRGIAVAGRYGWTLKAGKRTRRRGSVGVQKASGLALSANATLVARAR
ncbi:MAG: hypothetical protein WKF94_02445 [Solirubrobacteraceae bacterium]